jgi:hypothetical protein
MVHLVHQLFADLKERTHARINDHNCRCTSTLRLLAISVPIGDHNALVPTRLAAFNSK